MTTDLSIRPENSADIPLIDEITQKAFEVHPISQHTEQFIIKALRASSVLSISLVAEREGHCVGHIAFSPVTISDGTEGWFGLGPISVLPEFQNQGIGTRLMHKGLEAIRRLNAKGCALARRSEVLRTVRVQGQPETHHGRGSSAIFSVLGI